jgi:membrane protease YdiL (CAAX protease family)
MTMEPEILPPLPPEQDPLPFLRQPRADGPGLWDAFAFFSIAVFLVFILQGGAAVLALRQHWFGGRPLEKIVTEPRFSIPIMALAYGCILLVASLLFSRAWGQSFAAGVYWNFSTARKQAGRLLLAGMLLAVGIQLLSNYLPVPKELPVDSFFRKPLDAWMVALFGTLIAPAFEELAFRGFLYPALRRWTGALLAAVLSSIPFALLHAQQLAHAAAPISMVFLVSLVLTAVRQRTGSVAASALVHATYNLSIFLAVFSASGGFTHLERLKN